MCVSVFFSITSFKLLEKLGSHIYSLNLCQILTKYITPYA